MIAAEQFRRRLMANRADIDCGFYTLKWNARDWTETLYVQVVNDAYIGNIISVEVNGITVPLDYIIPTQNADMTVKVRLRNLYSCANLMQDVGNEYNSSKDQILTRTFPYSIDVSSLDTSNTYSMELMFAQCYIIGEITGLAFLDTSKVTNMRAMFYQARGYNPAEMVGWNTSNVTNMNGMFSTDLYGGVGLPTSFDLSSWDTSSVVDMGMMFQNQKKATNINVNAWDTSKVTKMGGMFADCDALESLDLSSFDFSAIEWADVIEENTVYVEPYSMCSMFAGCDSLKEVTMRGAISQDANTAYLFGDVATNGVFKYNPAHLADYQSKIFPKLPSTWTTQAL